VGGSRGDVDIRRVTHQGVVALPAYRDVLLREVYDGIDVRYRTDAHGRLKYDVLIAPWADPGIVRFRYDGADRTEVMSDQLLVSTSVGPLLEHRPWAYQIVDDDTVTVDCRFREQSGVVHFQIGRYDRSRPLTVDPTILVSTYVGGSLIDGAAGVDCDASGNMYVVGTTRSTDFRTTPGAYRRTPIGIGTSDMFVARLTPGGTALLAATYIGGNSIDEAVGVKITRSGNVVVAGITASTDFPATPGTPQPASGGGTDGVIVVLNSTLSALVASTYCGGSGEDRVVDVAIGPGDNPYVVGWTASPNFPVTPGAYTPPARGGEEGFVVRYAARLDTLRFSTRIGGGGNDRATAVTTEPAGNAWITGWTASTDFPTTDSAFARSIAGGRDAFVARLRFNGTALELGTFVGGAADEEGTAIAVDSSGHALVVGRTGSNNFPLSPSSMASPVGSWFALRVNWPATSALGYSRYLGVADQGAPRTIAADRSGVAFIAGTTSSSAFPISADGIASPGRGGGDLAFVRLSSDGVAVLHSSVIGGSRADSMGGSSHLTPLGDLIVAGTTTSPNFPIGRAAYDKVFNDGIGSFADGYVMQFAFTRRPSLAAASSLRFDTLGCDTVTTDTLWVYSVGDEPLTITDSYLRLGVARFTILEPPRFQFPRTVQRGDSLRYVIRFASSGQGTYRDTLVVESNDSLPGKRAYHIALEGIRAIPGLSSSPREIRFSPTLLCAPHGADSAVVISNDGQGVIQVLEAKLARGIDYSLGALPLLPRPLLERETFNAPIRFLPTGVGVRRDTLVVRFAECPLPLRIPVEGVGDSLALAFEDAPLHVSDIPWCVAAFDTTVTLINNSTRTARVAAAQFVGTGFALIDTLPRFVTAGGRLILRLRIAIPPGADTARLILRADTCGVAASIDLTASRRVRDTLSTDVASLSFGTGAGCVGDTLERDSMVVLRNTTGHPIYVPAPLVSAPFGFRGAPTFPVTLQSGDSIVVPLRYSPTVEAFHQGELIVGFESSGCHDTIRVHLFGGRYDERMEVSPDTIDFSDLAECDDFVDTVLVLRNTSSVPMTLRSVRSQGGAFVLRSIPFTIGPLGADTMSVRFSPTSAGVSRGSLRLTLGNCGVELPVEMRVRKEGVVLTVDGAPLRFPQILECQIPTTVDTSFDVFNEGNVGIDARIVAARVQGDPSITVDPSIVGRAIPAGGRLSIPLTFAPIGLGSYIGIVELVTEPCSDTMRVPIEGVVEPIRLAVTTGGIGSVPVGLSKLTTASIRNDNTLPITIDRIDSVAPPFRVTSIVPSLPRTLAPRDSLELTVEFAPTLVGNYSQVLWAVGDSPCSFAVPISLSAQGTGEHDTARFCIEGGGSGLVGDTVVATIALLSPEAPLPAAPNIRFRIGYNQQRLQVIDFDSDVAPLSELPTSERGSLALEQEAAPALGRDQARIRFRLLAGRENSGFASLDSVALVDEQFVPATCGDTVRWNVGDRCVVTGLAFGRYANLLESPAPNPAQDAVDLVYQQLEDARARVTIVDVSGRAVLYPLDQELPGGRYSLRVDISDLPTGLYFVVLDVGSYRASRSITITR